MGDRVGQQLGNYSLLRLVGQGSFADIYLGEHIHLHTQAAIKVLQVRLVENNIQNFLNEARTIAHLVHPYIIRVLDFGVQDTTPFLVMDYAPKGTFRQRFLQGKPLPPAPLASYMRQTAAALQYAHDRKLVHRDVKPENMLLGPNDEVLLSDFGFALASQSTVSNALSETAGTAAYMAPEQLQGKSRPASDQYSLGIIAYEWLTGGRPFEGSFFEIASQHMLTPPTPLRDKIPSIAREIETVVMTALEKDPKQRFPSVREFAVALGEACLVAQEYDFDLPSTPLPPQQLKPAVRKVEPDQALLSAFTKNTFTELSPARDVQEPFARTPLTEQQFSPGQQAEAADKSGSTMNKSASSSFFDATSSPSEYKTSSTQPESAASIVHPLIEPDQQPVQRPHEPAQPFLASNRSIRSGSSPNQSNNTPSLNFPSVQQYPSLSGIHPLNSTSALTNMPPLKPESALSDIAIIKPDATDTPAKISDSNSSPTLPDGTNLSLANISIIRPDETAPEIPATSKNERPATPNSFNNFNKSLADIAIIRPDDTDPRAPALEPHTLSSDFNNRSPQSGAPSSANGSLRPATQAPIASSSSNLPPVQPEAHRLQPPLTGSRPFAAGVFTASGILPTATTQPPQTTFPEANTFNSNSPALSSSTTLPPNYSRGQHQSSPSTRSPIPRFIPTVQQSGSSKSFLSNKTIMLAAALLIVIIIGGSILTYWVTTNQPQTPGTAAVSTKTTTTHSFNQTATATAIAMAHQANATATAVALSANPYPPNTGALVLNDPLVSGEQSTNWNNSTNATTGSSCQFASDGYHVIVPRILTGTCLASNTDYGNFTYEVQMTFNKIGTQYSSAGLVFRVNPQTNQYYRFEIYESGRYMLSLCTGEGDNCNALAGGAGSPIITAFNANLNHTNTLAIVAYGNTFTIYVNGKPAVDPITDPNSVLTTGTLGFYAHGGKDPIPGGSADVTFSKVRVWK